MGVTRAPVDGSGAAPAWMASVENPGVAFSGCGMGTSYRFGEGTREPIAGAKSTANYCNRPCARSCFSNLVVSLSNHGDACSAVLRQAQDEAGVRAQLTTHLSQCVPICCHALALGRIGQAAEPRGDVVAHVVRLGRAGDHAGDGGVAQNVLEEELAPAGAVELGGPPG